MIISENSILLVNPSGGWSHEVDGKYFFPISLLYLQNYLLKHDISSQIIDVKPLRLSPDRFKQLIKLHSPKVIGFTGSPFERHLLHEYIIGIKEFVPNALIVVGGPYFTSTAVDCLTHLKDVDVVVRGEGEITFLELVRAFYEKKGFENIAGITYRDKFGKIEENMDRQPANRDDCEIDIGLIRDDSTYSPYVYLKNYEKEKILSLPILLSRGCTNKCTFCFNNSSRFRSRSIPSIIDEIQRKRERFKCDYFWMVDPTFTLRTKFAYALCKELKTHCPGIKWYCETRADCDLPLLEEMAKAGCISVDFGLESGSPKVLKAIKKDLDVSAIYQATKHCKRFGMRVLVFVMYSLPEETTDDFKMTMRVLKRIKPFIYTISINQALILPGTEMEKQARSLNLLPENFSWYDPIFKSIPQWQVLMSDEDIANCRKTLTDYQYGLHHSRIMFIKRKIGEQLVISLGKQEPLIRAVRQIPFLHKILRSIEEWMVKN